MLLMVDQNRTLMSDPKDEIPVGGHRLI